MARGPAKIYTYVYMSVPGGQRCQDLSKVQVTDSCELLDVSAGTELWPSARIVCALSPEP